MKLLKLPMTIVLVLSMAAVVTAETYNTPTIDGPVAVAPDDWDMDELAADDPDTDCRYTGNPDLADLYITWDAYTNLDVFEGAIVDADYDGVPDTGYSAVEPLSWGRIKALFGD